MKINIFVHTPQFVAKGSFARPNFVRAGEDKGAGTEGVAENYRNGRLVVHLFYQVAFRLKIPRRWERISDAKNNTPTWSQDGRLATRCMWDE